MIVISSGRVHDLVNTAATASFVLAGLSTARLDLLACATGLLIGTIWLSPDLDLPHSLPTNRLGVFKLLYAPYRKLCGHHRSILSHSPVLSNLIRFVYTFTPFIALAVVSGHQDTVKTIFNSELFLWFYLGLEISTIVHLILDWQYSLRKRFRKGLSI